MKNTSGRSIASPSHHKLTVRNVRHNRYGSLACTALLLCSAMYAISGKAQALVDLSLCSSIPVQLDRLECYDSLAKVQASASKHQATVSAKEHEAEVVQQEKSISDLKQTVETANPASPAITVRATPTPKVAGFGQNAMVTKSDENTETLHDTVSAIKQASPNKWQLTLSSGQVWRQTVGKRFVIRVGDQVRISSTNWGNSYRLSIEGKAGYIQVNRVQ